MLLLDQEFVRGHLTVEACIPLVRDAMIALSAGQTLQPLRSVLHLAEGRAFGVMPGAMAGVFGAKLVSVYPENFAQGRPSHQGVITLFDPADGAPAALVHAGEVTRIRTACASAAATDVLARPDATRLAVLGYGEQARAHVAAMAAVRSLSEVRVWGRLPERARAFAADLQKEHAISIEAVGDVREAVRDADIICTVTAAFEPILLSDWVSDGTHINAVGSSYAGPVEIAPDLVARSRFIADYAPGVLAQGAEFLAAKQAGLIDDNHVVGEIGQVFAATLKGRTRPDEVTLYKSLGHVVQDLACAAWLAALARKRGGGVEIDF
ncbi:ornithine cyclodeaminase family protein [Brevundimonas sp.]|uniref:ornithine cyclodeaminase family protein n=1 Tax=Brevundimonas sp. TaxID=1871086 RepID=UPI001DC54F5D|nr:ornithine cyclodeaminase family protein [Brevundimonas sp.]MBA3999418.1 ornithine cyclodeaminase [Brevundimonas sp.]